MGIGKRNDGASFSFVCVGADHCGGPAGWTCIPPSTVCDGYANCPNGGDEENCNRGSAKVYDGYLKGLSTIHRTGLASMHQNTTHVTVRATIGVNDLAGSYKASAKFMNIGPSFGVKVFMESVGITFE